jgi:phosphate transport system substrate-binding protein
LRAEQVRAIYTGAVNGWEEVGGGEGPITVVNKAEGRATLEVFQKFFALSSEETEADVVIGDNQHGIKTVAGSPSAIAYVSIGAADYEARRGTAIKLLAVGGVEATPEAVARGQFPIARPLNLVVRQEPTGLTAAFLEFARSEAVHDLIEAQFFVPSRS